jgi:hypothetical protein
MATKETNGDSKSIKRLVLSRETVRELAVRSGIRTGDAVPPYGVGGGPGGGSGPGSIFSIPTISDHGNKHE